MSFFTWSKRNIFLSTITRHKVTFSLHPIKDDWIAKHFSTHFVYGRFWIRTMLNEQPTHDNRFHVSQLGEFAFGQFFSSTIDISCSAPTVGPPESMWQNGADESTDVRIWYQTKYSQQLSKWDQRKKVKQTGVTLFGFTFVVANERMQISRSSHAQTRKTLLPRHA